MSKTAVATETEVDPDAESETSVKPTVQVDPGLAKLVGSWKQADQVINNTLVKKENYFAQIVRYIKENKLSRPVVKKTLEDRGLKESSLDSTLSRIFKLAKDENEPILEKLEAGEFTQAQVRVAIAKPQAHPSRTIRDVIEERLFSAAKAAFSEPTIVDGVAAFRDLASAAWDKAKTAATEKANKSTAAAPGNGNGEESSTQDGGSDE